MTVGERIKKYRLAAGLTQLDVANAIGTTKQAIYKYENNIVTNIPTEKIMALANLFGIAPTELAGWEETIKPDDNIDGLIDQATKTIINLLKLFPTEERQEIISDLAARLANKK